MPPRFFDFWRRARIHPEPITEATPTHSPARRSPWSGRISPIAPTAQPSQAALPDWLAAILRQPQPPQMSEADIRLAQARRATGDAVIAPRPPISPQRGFPQLGRLPDWLQRILLPGGEERAQQTLEAAEQEAEAAQAGGAMLLEAPVAEGRALWETLAANAPIGVSGPELGEAGRPPTEEERASRLAWWRNLQGPQVPFAPGVTGIAGPEAGVTPRWTPEEVAAGTTTLGLPSVRDVLEQVSPLNLLLLMSPEKAAGVLRLFPAMAREMPAAAREVVAPAFRAGREALEAVTPGARRLLTSEAAFAGKQRPFFGGLRPEDVWDGLARAEKERAVKAAGLDPAVAAKQWTKVAPEERAALEGLVPERAAAQVPTEVPSVPVASVLTATELENLIQIEKKVLPRMKQAARQYPQSSAVAAVEEAEARIALWQRQLAELKAAPAEVVTLRAVPPAGAPEAPRAGLVAEGAIPVGEGRAIPTQLEIEHAKGVRAARDLGGQVPQRDVNAADATLRKAGLAPTDRRLPEKGQVAFIKRLYERQKPVVGDSFVTPTGQRIEITAITRPLTGGTSIDYMEMFGRGRVRTIRTEKEWVAISEAPRLVEEGGRIPEAEVVAKEPWQMTVDGYALLKEGALRRTMLDDIAEARAQGRPIEGIFSADRIEAVGKEAELEHGQIVSRAIAEGKPIPPEVLAEYPDLATGVTPRIPEAEVVPPGYFTITEGLPGAKVITQGRPITGETIRGMLADEGIGGQIIREMMTPEGKSALQVARTAEALMEMSDMELLASARRNMNQLRMPENANLFEVYRVELEKRGLTGRLRLPPPPGGELPIEGVPPREPPPPSGALPIEQRIHQAKTLEDVQALRTELAAMPRSMSRSINEVALNDIEKAIRGEEGISVVKIPPAPEAEVPAAVLPEQAAIPREGVERPITPPELRPPEPPPPPTEPPTGGVPPEEPLFERGKQPTVAATERGLTIEEKLAKERSTEGAIFVPAQTLEEVADRQILQLQQTAPDMMQRIQETLQRLPILRWLGQEIEPIGAAVARAKQNLPISLAVVKRALYVRTQQARANVEVLRWRAANTDILGLQNGVATKVRLNDSAQALADAGKIPKQSIGRLSDIIEHIEEYVLTAEQRIAIRQLQNTWNANIEALLKAGVDVNEVDRYFPRLVTKAPSGEEAVHTTAGALKARSFPTERDGFRAGYQYSDPIEAMITRLTDNVSLIANKRLFEQIRVLGEKPSERLARTGAGVLAARKTARESFDQARDGVKRLETNIIKNQRAARRVKDPEKKAYYQEYAENAKLELSDARATLAEAERELKRTAQSLRQAARKAAEPSLEKGEIKAAGRIFPKEVGRELKSYGLEKFLPEDPILLDEFFTIYRGSMVTGDYSQFLVQGNNLLWRDPHSWFKAVAASLEATIRTPDNWLLGNIDAIRSAIAAGAASAPEEFLLREGGKISRFFAKFPLVKQTQRSFEWFSLVDQVERWKALQGMTKMGGELAQTASIVRKQAGVLLRPGLTKGQLRAERYTFFAPRFMGSLVSLVTDALRPGVAGDEARKILSSIFVGATAATTAWQLVETGELPNFIDPDEDGWFSVRKKTGETINLYGPLYPYFRAMAQFGKRMVDRNYGGAAEAVSFLTRGRVSATIGPFIDFMTGRNVIGQRIEQSPLGFFLAYASRAGPIGPMQIARHIQEVMQKGTRPFPEIIGEVAGLRTADQSTIDKFDYIARQVTGDRITRWKDLPPTQRLQLESSPEVKALLDPGEERIPMNLRRYLEPKEYEAWQGAVTKTKDAYGQLPEIKRLGMTLGSVGDEINKQPLTLQERAAYQYLTWKLAEGKYLPLLFANTFYRRASDEIKKRMINDAMSDAREEARGEVWRRLIQPRLAA